tara:strand:- start:11 stop:256 length:246 start_codon:yes stop_codon:yes gene_type:complete
MTAETLLSKQIGVLFKPHDKVIKECAKHIYNHSKKLAPTLRKEKRSKIYKSESKSFTKELLSMGYSTEDIREAISYIDNLI